MKIEIKGRHNTSFQELFEWKVVLIPTISENFAWIAHFVPKWHEHFFYSITPLILSKDKNRCKMFQMTVIDLNTL